MAVTAADLTKLYLAYFGRPPDFDGLQFYTSPANANLTIAQVAAGFSASAESQALYGSTSLAGMINNIYMNIFGRPADVSGLQFWSDAINSGKVTPALAAYNILTGALLLNNADGAVVLNKLAVATAWDQALDTPAEIVGYTGATAASTARAFLATVDGTPASLAAHSGAALDAAINAAINAQGQITASVNAPSVTEGDAGTKVLAFTITLDKAPTVPLTLNFSAIGGTAVANDDFTATSGAVVFAAGQTTATVNVTVLGDTAFEGNETVTLVVTGPLANAGGTFTATGTIVDDDPTPAQLTYVASVSAPVVDEGNTGTTTLAFVIHLDHPAVGPVTVNYQTLTTGSGTAGTDFISSAGTIVFANGQQDAVVNVVVNGDVTVEDTETVVLQVTGTQLSNSGVTATGTITNDDAQPLLTQQIDNIVVQGAGANTIKGIVDGTTPGNSTFSIGDNIVGNGVTVLELNVAATGTGAFANVDNVATINVIAGVGGPITFNAIQWDNIGSVNLAAGVNGATVNISNLETGVDLGIGASIGGQLAVTYQDNDFVNLFNFGKGGASFDADGGDVVITMGNAVPQFTAQSAGLVIASSNDVTLNDVMINGGADNAAAVLSLSASGDINVAGDISLSVGDATSTSALDSVILAAGGDISVAGAIVEIAGSSASAALTVSASGDVSLASVGQNVGPSGAAAVAVGAGGMVTIGGIAQTGATGAVEAVSVTASSDVNVGGMTQLGAATATAHFIAGGNVDVGAVTQSATVSASLTASASGSGDVTFGDVAQAAGSSNALMQFFAHGGDIDVGLLSQNFGGSSGNITVSNTSGGDISIGGVSQIGAGSGTAFLSVTATSSADILIGDIFQSVATSGFMSVTVNASGTGDINVGDITQTGVTSASARVGLYGSHEVNVGDVNIVIGDASASASASAFWASFSVNADAGATVGDITLVAGNNANAYAYVSNSGTGDVVIGDVHLENGGNTNTTAANTNNVEFFAYNFAATGDLTVGDVEMIVGDSNTGTMSISLTDTFNESLGDLTVGDIDVTLADKANIGVVIRASATASTSAAATNVVNVGDMTVGDINVVMGTNASFSLSLDHNLYQSGTNPAGDLGDTTVGLVTVDAGVGANVTIDYTISNTVVYTTSGTAALVVNGAIGDVSLGGFDIAVDDGGSISVSVDIFGSGAIGDVSLGDLKARVGVSGTVQNFDVSVTGSSVGDVMVGDIALLIGQSGSATSGIDVHVSATAGDIGDITVGDINIVDGESATNQTVSLSFTAAGNIGAVSFGDVSLTNGKSGSMDGLNLDIIAGGDIESFSMGDFNAIAGEGASFSTMFEVHLSAANIGDVTFGDHTLTIGLNATSQTGDSISITAVTDIGNVTFGDLVYSFTGTGGSADGLFVTVDAGGTLGDVTVGDVTMNVITSASVTSGFFFHLTGVMGVGDVEFGNVALMGMSASGSQELSIDVNATSGDIGNFTLGDVDLSSVKATATTIGAWLNVTVSASDDIGDVTLGNLSLNASSGNAWATLNFVHGGDIGDLTVGDIDLVAATSGQAYFSISMGGMTSDDVATIGTISFSGDSTTVSVTANIYAGTADVSIEGVTVHGTGAAQFGSEYNLSVTGGDIEIGTIKLEVTASTSAYNVTSVLASVAATGTVTLGTVDYSGYKEAAAGQAGETINVSAFAGTIVVIGTDRDDVITGNDETNTFTGGDGNDQFDFTGVTAQDIDAIADARIVDTITDFKAGPTASEKILVDAQNTGVAYYAEKSAATLDAAITVALQAMADPVNEADIVAVKVGSDTYVMVDMAGNDHIDTIIKLVGVDTNKLDYADFTVS